MEFSNFCVDERVSWSDDEPDTTHKGTGVFLQNLQLSEPETNQEENLISIDILPEDMHARILSCLPLVSIFKASCVSKKWNEIIYSKNLRLKDANLLSEKTWYFMFSSSVKLVGYIYDPSLRKWYDLELPFVVHNTWNISPSCGLVCFMDDEVSKNMYICNPITRQYEILETPPSPYIPLYTALGFSVDQSKYTISVVRLMQAFEDNLLWNVSIHVYDSNEKSWLPPVMGAMEGWRPGDVSVICDNILYILVFNTRPAVQMNHGLATYNLENTETSIDTLKDEYVISVPCVLTCGRLINIKRKLILVGGIGRSNRPGVIKGIGIWVLEEGGWKEIAKMPHKFVNGFGKLDDVFASSGGGDLIYIQCSGEPALLVYDMGKKDWFFPHETLMHQKTFDAFSGFCFEPRLQFL